MKSKLFIMVAFMALTCCSFNANGGNLNLVNLPVVSVSASSEWDKILDEYEQYVDQYVKLYKKAMSGDMSALSEYTSLMQKAQKLSDKLGKAKNDLTSAQLQRYLKITQKMADAMK